MRTLLHISDLHFGRVDPATLFPLRDVALEVRPDLTVVSGDLTQRARSSQFRAAHQFLEILPGPRLVVPGNHDVPMHNPLARFLSPLGNYRRYISTEPEPYYQDAEMAVLGLNSSRSFTVQDGRLNEEQVKRMVQLFRMAGDGVMKVLVCHHPFVLPPGAEKNVLEGADDVLRAMGDSRVDLALTGHLHTSFTSCSVVGAAGWGVLIAQAGTATSLRTRGEAGSFNIIRMEQGRIDLEHRQWDSGRQAFLAQLSTTFTRGRSGWRAEP